MIQGRDQVRAYNHEWNQGGVDNNVSNWVAWTS